MTTYQTEGRADYQMIEFELKDCLLYTSSQFSRLKKIVYEADPNAFVMVTDTSEVFGLGFKNFTE